MFGRLITYVAAGLVALLVAGPATADARYGNKVSTSCNVNITARAGKPISAYIDVKGNASATITGTVTVSVYRVGASARPVHAARDTKVWSTSARYNGHPLRLHGPVLRHGHYRAVAKFSADPGVYLDCQCFGRFGTKAIGGQHNGNGGNPGGLPNTGGPSQWWLVLGFGLLLAGGSAVYAGRRRAHAHHGHHHAHHHARHA
jgi:LPXTG-motif cell wall-anchored protein